MKATDFINNTEAGLNFIKETLRENSSYEDNAYWFHFSIEDDEVVSKGCNTDAEYTVHCDCDTPNSVEYITAIGKKYGYELKEAGENENWYEINTDGIDKFIDNVVNEFENSEEFDEVASTIYEMVLEEIQ